MSTEDASTFIYRALDNGKMRKRWSDGTAKRIAAYLMGCCHDFGLLAGNRGKNRPFQRFAIRTETALYLTHDLHCAGASDSHGSGGQLAAAARRSVLSCWCSHHCDCGPTQTSCPR